MAIARKNLDCDRDMNRTAAMQRSLISKRQLTELGVSSSSVSRRVASGRLRRVSARVYALPGPLLDFEQRVLAAILATDGRGVASGRTAAALMNLDGFPRSVIEITVPADVRLAVAGVVVHRSDLPEMDVQIRNGLPMTTPARTLLDLGGVASFEDVEMALEDVLRRNLASLARLRWYAQARVANGRPGSATLKQLMAQRPKGYESSSSRPTGSSRGSAFLSPFDSCGSRWMVASSPGSTSPTRIGC